MNDDAIDTAITVLNRIHQTDPTVLPALIAHRIECNEALADDPTVQVGPNLGGGFEVGLLGIINGLYGCDEQTIGFIGANYDDDHQLLGFVRLGTTGQRTP